MSNEAVPTDAARAAIPTGPDLAFLVGSNVYLRPFEREDLVHTRRWFNDPETRVLIGSVLPESRAGAEAWYDRIKEDQARVWFALVLREGDRVIGEAGLLRMHHFWRTTDLTMIIGERDAQNRGYGREAIDLLLDYAFGALNFHRVAVGVVGFNHRALRFYEKVGFRREGVQRDGYYHQHAYHDFVMMSILEEEYRRTRRSRD